MEPTEERYVRRQPDRPSRPSRPGRPRRRRARLGAGLGAVVLLVLAWGSIASAHVTIQPPTAPQGGYTKVTFRVPSERDVPTIKLAVKFPEDHPFAGARVKPVPGWQYEIAKKPLATPIKTETGEIKEAVDTITWTGGSIAATEFQEFEVSLGPLPKDTDVLYFPAIQTYEGGEEVLWSELPEGDKELDHPAPKLTLTPAAATGGATTTTAAAAPISAENVAAAPVAATTSESSSNTIAWVAVGLGVAALLLAIVAVVRSGKPASTA